MEIITAEVNALQKEGGEGKDLQAAQLPELTAKNVSETYAGKLKNHLNIWKRYTHDSVVLDWVKGYKIPFIKKPFQKYTNIPRLKPREKSKYERVIQDLKKVGAIEECNHEKGEFLSTYFLRKKSNNKFRFILNLKQLNKFIVAPHFKLEDYKTANNAIVKNCFLAKIDLKDAYFSIPISKKYRKYLKFKLNNKLFQFTCMPFGLNIAPYVFTKILKPILKHLRSEGIQTVVYLDDWLVLGKSKQICLQSVRKVICTLKLLGFLINIEKSILEPTKECTFLGFNYNTSGMSIKLPQEKKDALQQNIQKFSVKKRCKVREFARLIGKLVAASPAVEYGWLYIKNFEREKQWALLKNKKSYEGKMSLSPTLKEDFHWWLQNIKDSKQYIETKQYSGNFL